MLARRVVILVLATSWLGLPGRAEAQPGGSKAPASKASAAPAASKAPPAGTKAPATPPAAGKAPAATAAAAAAPAEIVPTTVAAKHRKAVFDAYVQAARVSDWKKAAGYFDPQVLASLHDLMSKILREAAAKGEDRELLKLFGGVASADEFARQTPAQTFAGFMSGLTQSSPALKDALATAQFQYLGEVPENENLVHIIYRTRLKVSGIDSAKVAASSMSRTADGWRLLLDDEVEGFAKMLEQQVLGNAPPQAP